jgi:hypothetical protein
MISEYFVILGFAIQIIGSFGYCLDTLRGKIQPNRITWLLWSLIPMVAFFAQRSQGVEMQSLMTFSVGFIPLFVLLASFFNAKAVWKLGKFDFICGFLSLLGILLWYITKEGNIAIIFSIAADFLAAIPTVIKSYTHPQSESINNYFAAILNSIITILTIKKFDFANSSFAFYILFINSFIFFLVKFKVKNLIYFQIKNSQ